MFTGIIEETGRVETISRKGADCRLKVSCGRIAEGLKVGDSIAVNGVCLSVANLGEAATEGSPERSRGIVFDVVGNTLSKTNLKRLKIGDAVNLESAMRLGDKVSGHMVTGHVDGERVVKNSMNTSKGWVIDIAKLKGDERYLVARGSVAVDGVSLTVAEIYSGFFRVYLIPLTLDETQLKLKKPGNYVNVEFDMIAKYAERQQGRSVTEETLRRAGFIGA